MKTYVIHSNEIKERDDLVQNIIDKTSAILWPAIVLENRVEGCHTSHFQILQLDKEEVLIFEDDCEILSENFLSPLLQKDDFDIIYLGVNKIIQKGSWGCHAMYISSKAKECYFKYDPKLTAPIDNVWNEIEEFFQLRVWRPNPINALVQQKKGLKSTITGKIR